jgi:hypothetical protein
MLKRLALSTLIMTFGLFLSTLVGFSPRAEAKDMRQRLGIGVKNNSSFDLPSLAAVYWAANEIAFTGGIGMDTQKDNSKLSLSAGVRRMIFFEDHLNFYFGGNLAMINYEVASDKQSGWELSALFGTEFFLPGLDNLGFTFEGGAGVISMREVRFRTVADNPLRAGIIFYF